MFRANFCPSSGVQDWGFFTTCGIMSCCCGRQGFGARQRGTMCLTQLPSYRTRSATLPRSESLPTTTTGHYTTFCKKPQSCAPEVRQNFARNMLSWSLEINKTVIVASRWFLFYLTYIDDARSNTNQVSLKMAKFKAETCRSTTWQTKWRAISCLLYFT